MTTASDNKGLDEADLNGWEQPVRQAFLLMLRQRQKDGMPGFNLPDELFDQIQIVGRKIEFNPTLGDAFATLCLELRPEQAEVATCQLMYRIFKNPVVPKWFSILCLTRKIAL
ncbi:MAG: hypothetical protein ABIH67_00780 [Candidatus Uhrbacteria bacterium]